MLLKKCQQLTLIQILSNIVFLALGTVLVGLQRLLYGPLRPIEVEQLYERAWISLTETCLAMTIFREEVGFWFIVMFVLLLIGKVWGWISEGRVDILEQQPPANPRLFHARLSSSLVLSFLFDSLMLYYTVSTVRQQARPNMMVMFAFEFAVLTTISASTCARYVLSLKEAAVIKRQTAQRMQEQRQRILQEREEANRETREIGEEGPTFPPLEEELNELEVDVPGWEEKGRWVFYLNIVTGMRTFRGAARYLTPLDFLKLFLYMTFFCVLCVFYGMPIHIIRDVAYTVQSFYRRINDFVKYRYATRDMNERYPDATAEQIGREDTCIICREVMREWQPAAQPPMEDRLRPKKLPCGHVLHLACLRSWLERQQNCPTCRQNVLDDNPPGQNNANRQGNAPPQDGENRPAGDAAPRNGRRGQDQNRQRMRFLNLGPLRVGYGAVDGEDLQRELRARAEQGGDHRQDAAPNAVFRRAFGFEFGAGRQQAQNRSSNTSTQLQDIERQLTSEMNINMLQQEQLRVIRAMQGELARLRIRQAQIERGDGDSSGLPPLPAHSNPPSLPPMASGPSAPGMQSYVGRQQQMLGPGHPDLPTGVVIPDGWHLMPLELYPNMNGLAHPPAAQQPPAPQTNPPSSESANSRAVASPSPQPPSQQSSQEPGRDASVDALATDRASTSDVSAGALSVNRTDAPPARNQQSMPQQANIPTTSPSLPQWGSSVPSSSTAEASNSLPPENEENSQETANNDKGKRQAPTVEDAADDDEAGNQL